jgi:hypothetical protein
MTIIHHIQYKDVRCSPKERIKNIHCHHSQDATALDPWLVLGGALRRISEDLETFETTHMSRFPWSPSRASLLAVAHIACPSTRTWQTLSDCLGP